MKRNLTLITVLLFIASLPSLMAQIPNAGFENWNNQLIFEDPTPYNTSNLQTYFSELNPNVTKITGHTGNYSVKIETVSDGNDTIEGMILLADPYGLSGGYPFTERPDSIYGFFNYNFMPGDTGILAVVLKNSGIYISYDVFPLFGSSSGYMRRSFPLTKPIIAPDTVMFLLSSSDLDGGIPGSWVEADELTFVNSTQQLPNNGFENWAGPQFEDPDDWFTVNLYSTLFGAQLSTTKSTDSHSGSYAARLESVLIDFGFDADTMGWMTNGTFGDYGPIGGTPFNAKPQKLTGYYKYTPVGPDTALAMVVFYKWNSSTQQRDSLEGAQIKLSAATGYTKFEIPVNLTLSPTPDTVLIVFASGNFAEEGKYVGLGSVLLLDDLAFEYGTGDRQPLNDIFKPLSVYPNPAKDRIFFRTNQLTMDEMEIMIFDIIGNRVFYTNDMMTDGVTSIDISLFETGVYFYKATLGEQSYSGKIVKE